MSDDRYPKLEALLIDYAPDWERRNPRWRGHASFTLLSGIPGERLSEEGRKHLEELRRKFEREAPEPPRGIFGGAVGSPIGLDHARHMTDEQWRGAMKRHSSEWGNSNRMDLRGGANELATQILQELTKEDPDRFARLATTIDSSYHPSYLAAILIGVADSQGAFDSDLVYDLIRHAAAVGGQDRWLGYALKRLYKAEIPADVVRS